MKHYSTKSMVEMLTGLLGTSDLTQFEQGFVESMQKRLAENTFTSISERQAEVLENIFGKHFA